MKITHVIRAEEHLSNTPRQIFIAQGLGYPLAEYAHVPFVAEPGSKNKLSKRKLKEYLKNPDFRKVCEHGQGIAEALGLRTTADTFNPVIVDFYRQVGYLPYAVVNYLLLLGWSLDDRTEFFTRDEMIAHFSLERVNKAPASFDAKKLLAFQEHYQLLRPVEDRVQSALPYLMDAKLISSPPPAEVLRKVRQVVGASAHRLVVAGDILEYGFFFVADDRMVYDDKAFEKHLQKPAGAGDMLRKLRAALAAVEPYEPSPIEALVQGFVQSEGRKIGEITQALRVAVTGKGVGFGTYETLAILGREHCLARIDRTLARL
jgi:glutamyl-tRNA synthetase